MYIHKYEPSIEFVQYYTKTFKKFVFLRRKVCNKQFSKLLMYGFISNSSVSISRKLFRNLPAKEHKFLEGFRVIFTRTE